METKPLQPQQPPKDAIWIVTDVTPETAANGSRRGGGLNSNWGEEVERNAFARKGIPVSARKLEAEMTQLIETIGRIFRRAEQQAAPRSGLQLQEVELSIEISSEGQVYLIGNGAKAGGKGAITLKFSRVQG
jgi:hypothetical protein